LEVSGFGSGAQVFGFRLSGFEFRVLCCVFRVSGSGFGASNFGVRLSGSGVLISSSGVFRVQGFEFRVLSSRVSGFRFRVSGFRFRSWYPIPWRCSNPAAHPDLGSRQLEVRGWAPWKVDVRLPGKGNAKSHRARPVHLITMMKWTRISRLSCQ